MYSVTLAGIRDEVETVHCGSGTLIVTGHRHFILTASHCAKPLFELERFGLPIRNEHALKVLRDSSIEATQ